MGAQLKVWKKVCFALFLRELQSQFNDKLGLTWAFIEPFVFIFGLAYLRSFVRASGDAHGLPIFIFILIGLVLVQSFLQPFNKVAASFNKNKPLYAFRQVQPIAGLLVSAFVEYIIKLTIILLSCLAIYLLKIDISVDSALLLIVLFHILWLMTISLSCLLGVGCAYLPEIQKIVGIFTRPLLFISCVFFSLQDLPQEYWAWFTWNPLVHFIELSRYAVLESYGDAGVNIMYPTIFTVVAFFFAVCLYHLTWKGILSR